MSSLNRMVCLFVCSFVFFFIYILWIIEQKSKLIIIIITISGIDGSVGGISTMILLLVGMKMIEWVRYYATQINFCPTLSVPLNHGDFIYPCKVCGSSNWVSQEPPSLKEP